MVVIHSTCVRRLIAKKSILPKFMYRFDGTSMKTPSGFFVGTSKLIAKFIRKCREPRRVQIAPEKKDPVGRLAVPDFVIKPR